LLLGRTSFLIIAVILNQTINLLSVPVLPTSIIIIYYILFEIVIGLMMVILYREQLEYDLISTTTPIAYNEFEGTLYFKPDVNYERRKESLTEIEELYVNVFTLTTAEKLPLYTHETFLPNSIITRLEQAIRLAEGVYGTVYSIKDTSEKEMAIKICIKETDYHDKPQVEFLGALKQASLDNPFIVPIKGIFQYRGALKTGLKTVEVGKRNAILLIVMPYFKTNLDNIFLKKPKYLLKIFLDVALGLQYLHSKKIYHRDIKPANILITKDIYSKTFRAVICDFSLAAIEQVLPNTYSNKYKANEKQLKNAKSEKKIKKTATILA